jgi:hypothetical protein
LCECAQDLRFRLRQQYAVGVCSTVVSELDLKN